jgi:hypothetical protein
MRQMLRVAAIFFLFFSSWAKELQIPIKKVVGSLVIMEVELDKSPFLFLLDSGSNANFIDHDSVEKLEKYLIRNEKDDRYVSTFGSRVLSRAYQLNLALSQDFNFPLLPSYVMNTQKFDKKLDGIKCCDGILGIDFIKRFPLEVNIEKMIVTIHQKRPKLKGWKKLPVDVEGKNILTFKCRAGDDQFKLRLDSGNEVPLIFHTHAVKKFLLREQLYDLGFAGAGLPFLKLKDLRCGDLAPVSLTSTFFEGTTGALTHKFVDGNAGSHLLGSHYFFDVKGKAVFAKNQGEDVKVPGKVYDYRPDFKFTRGHISTIHQAQALIINSCSDSDSFQDCVKKLCTLQGRKLCVFKETGSVFEDYARYLFPFRSKDCSIAKVTNELRTNPVKYNYCWYKLTEINSALYQNKLKEIEVPKTLKDVHRNLVAYEVTNPFTFTKDFYCYSNFQGIIKMKDMPASLFGLSVKGLSFSNKRVGVYRDWLKSKAGQACVKEVKRVTGEEVATDFSKYFADKTYVALVNPFTILGDGTHVFDETYTRTLNHEILHSVYDMYPSLKKKAKSQWEALSGQDKLKFVQSHPSYNFANNDILYKEYFTYTYETRLEEVFK